MLMFISFPAIVAEWVALDSLIIPIFRKVFGHSHLNAKHFLINEIDSHWIMR